MSAVNKPRAIEFDGWKLVYEKSGHAAVKGDSLTSHLWDTDVLAGGTPPRHPASTGRIEVGGGGRYFPGVFGLRWVRIEKEKK